MFGRWKLNQATVICVLLGLAVATVYLPAVFLDFTNYDDTYYVTENPHVRGGLTRANVAWFFTHTCVANWQPVTLLSHALDCQIYGLNPAGHHLTSVLLHGANTIVLFLLLQSMTGAAWRSAAVAALFALHPLHVESVAWISERKDVLSTLFGLLSLWAYVKYVWGKSEIRNPKPETNPKFETGSGKIYYVLALAFFALGLMSKSMLVTWPCVMLLLDYWPLGRLRFAEMNIDGEPDSRRSALTTRRLIPVVVEKLPFFALSMTMSIVTFFTFKEGKAVAPLEAIPIGTRVLSAAISYIGYMRKLIWPSDLAPIYPRNLDWPVWEMAVAPVLLAVITALAIWKRDRRPYALAGWAWYLGTLLPVIGLVQIGSHAMADRYTYIPAIGLMWSVVWMAADCVATGTWRQMALATAATAGLLSCTIIAQKQLMYWQNTETLFRHAVAVTSNNYIAWSSLAFDYAKRHEAREAEQCFRTALAIKPRSTFLLDKLAGVLIDQGRYDEAMAQCETALQLEPQMAAAHGTVGLALMKQGKTQQAIEQYEESLRLDPEEASAHYNLANALARQGEYEKAREHYQESVRLEPTSAEAHNNLGYMLTRENKLNDAMSEFRAALALEPGSWHARYGLGDALARQGKLKEAANEFLEVLKIEPKAASAQAQINRIAWILASAPDPQTRDGAKALELTQRVCELTSYTNAVAIETLAVARAETGHFTEAITSAEQARSLASSAGQNEVARKAEELLELFRAGQPYREQAGSRPR
jgi:tetratricopeptide (TPR) repeat protein